MEQHPVPQNVTTFQFRLIGDMTIKQFGYLAGGAIIGYICYKLPLPFFFTWPMATLFALGGVGFAFVPIEERPMDVWVLSFIKNIYSPTQFVWSQEKKEAAPVQPAQTQIQSPAPSLAATPSSRAVPDVLRGVFNASPKPTTPQPMPTITHVSPLPRTSGPTKVLSSTVHKNPWAWIMELFAFPVTPKTQPAPIAPQAQYKTPNITGTSFDLSSPPQVRESSKEQKEKEEVLKQTQEKEVELESKVSTLKQELADKTMTEARVLELQKQLTEILAEKEIMEKELTTLRRQTSSPLPTAVVPAAASPTHVATPQAPKQPTVKIITPEGAVKAGLPRLTTFPNVVTGITKDSDNNFLPGVLVTVKDRDGMPLRALKTNRLGQFAASTPLANGIYFVEIEDPRSRYIFDRVQITLNGSIVPALEIIAKSQKQLSREKLAKEIFGNVP